MPGDLLTRLRPRGTPEPAKQEIAMTKPVGHIPSDFDYGYRPTSYFDNLNPCTLIVASILGEERRKYVLERFTLGSFDPLVWGEWITASKLDDVTRRIIQRTHPRFAVGELLPGLESDEFEIARIIYCSESQDVISVRARRWRKRIAYRVVDETDGEFVVAKKWSYRPLSFMELIGLINGSDWKHDEIGGGLVFSFHNWIIYNEGDFGERCDHVSVSSIFYPDLARYYNDEIARFLSAHSAGEDAELIV